MTDITQSFNGKTVTIPCKTCCNRFEQEFDSRTPLKMYCPGCVAKLGIVVQEVK